MNLNHIELRACPDCAETKVRETRQWHQHCNGQWNESLEFECRYSVEHSPNFSKSEVTSICERSEAYLAMKSKREAARAKVRKYIGKLDVDDSYKKALHKKVEYVYASTID